MCDSELNNHIDFINQNCDNNDKNLDYNQITNSFRYLRNICATNPEVQSKLIQDSNILSNTKKILFDILTNRYNQEQVLCLQIGLQFLANLIVKNKNNQQQVWFTCQDLLDDCVKFENAKVQTVAAMILYNIFLGNPEFLNDLSHGFEHLYKLTLNENTSEFSVLTLEIFILKSNYIVKFYDQLKPENRIIILEIVKNILDQNVSSEIIQFFSKQFTSKSDLILKTSEDYANSLDPVEIVKILDLLVAFSSDDTQSYFKVVQKEASLLINCVMLLRSIHSVSKEKGNNFSMITKISEISEVEKNSSVQENPIFGFKCSLIRLIGNFCWKNVDNQNKVRELDCIPVLLDCCNIDARNPFIIQWCILAIRNICEKNIENQQVIASLSKEGVIDSARLQELGIMLNTDSSQNSICIAPLK